MVYIPFELYGPIKLSKRRIRVRKIGLRDENVVFCIAKAPPRSQVGLSHSQRVLVVARTV